MFFSSITEGIRPVFFVIQSKFRSLFNPLPQQVAFFYTLYISQNVVRNDLISNYAQTRFMASGRMGEDHSIQ